VLLYVLSAEPLTCPGLVSPVKYSDPNGAGSDFPGELEYSFPAGAVRANRLPKCSADLPRLAHRKWAFVKLRKVFRPEEMQDLHFQPLFPLIRSNLEGSNHYQALARLGEFEELAMPLCPDLATSPVADNRVTCCAMLHAYPRQGSVDLLLKLLDDEDINVRFQACAAAEAYNEPRVISKLLVLVDDKSEIGRAAILSCGKLGVSDPRVISALIEVLDYQYPTPREEAQASLTRITGEKFQSPQQWRDWWAKSKASFMTR
jgi:HEAT repeats